MIDTAFEIITALSFIVTGATIIAKFTETKKDDEILSKVHKYLKAIADLKKPDDK